jgi:Protein involved in formate dehydrogenase formation
MQTKPVDSHDTHDPIAQRLCALAHESPDLKAAAQLYEAVLPVLRSADLRVAPVAMTSAGVRSKMEKGLPLLSDLDLELDAAAARELMLRLARAVEALGEKNPRYTLRLPWRRASQKRDSAAGRIRLAIEERRLDPGAFLPLITANERMLVTAAAQDLNLDPDLVWTLAQNALKPALRAWCRQLTPLAEGVPWHKGSCFVCGAAATLGELQENDQVKHLRCGQCGADWTFRRLQCMYCGNEDQKTLGCLYQENRHEQRRVEVCERCKGYLKVIPAFAPAAVELLTVEDLETLPLDYIAQKRGYARGVVQ